MGMRIEPLEQRELPSDGSKTGQPFGCRLLDRHAPREVGCVEHIAFNVSRSTFQMAPARLTERGIEWYQRDRGFMDSIYLRDPNGLKVELACYKFETPEGFRAADVLMTAQRLRVERGDHHIAEEHLADAIELLLATRERLPG